MPEIKNPDVDLENERWLKRYGANYVNALGIGLAIFLSYILGRRILESDQQALLFALLLFVGATTGAVLKLSRILLRTTERLGKLERLDREGDV